ncbi:general transcription repressor, variant 2 [Basidiobolus ranarum]|uniref:General transcription repressor, variant 2 n=1 Tax=Basidiobolus ranarum TaxID=34480 RepID=A0ABR2VNF4_9FUNG
MLCKNNSLITLHFLVSTQLNEVSGFQQNLYELERAHQTVRQQYEDEIMRLRRDLEARGTPHQAHQPAPPNIGAGPSNLFGGIMSGTPNGPHSLVAPPQMMDPNRQPQSQHPGSGSGPPGLSAYSSGGLSGASHQQLPPTHGGHQALNKRPRDDSNAPPYHMGGQSQPSMLPLSKYGSTPMSTSLPGLMGQGSGQPQ